MSFDKLLNQVATVKRLEGTKDRYGNVEREYETHASNVMVRVDPTAPGEVEGSSNSTSIRARIFTRYYDIKSADILEVNGENWQVTGPPVERRTAALSHHFEIDAKLVTV
jgi:hypothetical protein